MPAMRARRYKVSMIARLWSLLHVYAQEACSAADFSDVRFLACDELGARKKHN
jgi:hypothetical protein